jgi:GntR family transcriptional regulator
MNKRGNLEQPLYNKVRGLILIKLRNGEWKPGEKIPTEPELAKIFSVSVGTVRKAVEDLVTEQVLIRRARIGTTVSTHEKYNQFSTFFNFSNRLDSEMQIEPKLLSFKKVLANEEIGKSLGVQRGEALFEIDNIRLIDDKPTMFDRIWLPQKKFMKLTQNEFENRKGSVYSLYQSQFMMTIVRINEQVEAIQAPEFVRLELGLKKTDPVLKISRYAYTFGDEVVEYRNRYVNSQISLYQNEIGLRE